MDFDIYQAEELKKCLYYSCIHDAKIEAVSYECVTNELIEGVVRTVASGTV